MRNRYAVALSILFLTSGCVFVSAGELLHREHKTLDASGVTAARLDTSAGYLRVIGDPSTKTIEIDADYKGNPRGRRQAEEILEDLRLTAEVRGDTFYLKTENRGTFNWGNSGSIDVTVKMPDALVLQIEDGSGSLEVLGMGSDVTIDDGSGSIEIRGVRGRLEIEDGSGSIDVVDVGQSVSIRDGSGSIDVRDVGGDIQVRDGSGSISVSNVGGNFEVISDGSGSIRHRDVRGEVRIPDRKKRRNR